MGPAQETSPVVTAETLTSERKHLHELLSHFSTVMVGTFEQAGSPPALRARPMGVAQLDQDCTMHFITAVDTQKVDEAARSELAHVFGQSTTRFFSLRGRIEISQDPALLHRIWNRLNDVWFTGPEDPRAAVVTFRPEEAELWDASGLHGVRFLFEAARALLSGQPATQPDVEQHQRFGVTTVQRFAAGGNAD